MVDDARREGEGRDAPPHPTQDDPPPLGSDARRRSTGTGGTTLLPRDRASRVLTLALLVLLVIALAGVVAVAVAPPETEDPFTEFYVLGANGTAAEYPAVVAPGEDVTATLGVENHEHERVTYGFVAEWNDSRAIERNVTLDDGERLAWNATAAAPEEPGTYRLRYHLHGGSGENPQSLRLWVRVVE